MNNATIDRAAMRRGTPHLIRDLLQDEKTLVVDVWGDQIATTLNDENPRLALRAPNAQDPQDDAIALFAGVVERGNVVAMLRPHLDASDESAEPNSNDEIHAQGLRAIGLALPDDELAIALTAIGLANWHATHTHCPRCGAPTSVSEAGWVRVCDNDGSQHFPRTDPAVIMAIVDEDDRILLARGKRWDGVHRSVLAGFVEPGESLEAAVIRETYEESGVHADAVTYVGNQPWPFPASLMVGFMAHARTTELTPQPGEIEVIAWYSRADVEKGLAEGTLRLPGKLSIARALIERWYGGVLPESARSVW